MISKGKLEATTFILIITGIFSGVTPTCDSSEYQIGSECCQLCPEGTQVKQDCTKDKPRSCEPCADGAYMDKPNGLKQCSSCGFCDAGLDLVVKQACTASSDTMCGPAEGFFCLDSTESSCSAAQKHKICAAGESISKPGTSSSDTECSVCPHGTFSDGSSSSCQPHTQCEEKNLQQIKEGTSTSDAQCAETSIRIGAIIGGVVGVIFIVVAVILYVKRKKLSFLLCGQSRQETNPRKAEQSKNPVEMQSLSLEKNKVTAQEASPSERQSRADKPNKMTEDQLGMPNKKIKEDSSLL